MPDARELRKQAEKYRYLASIKTAGGQAADRRLVELAYQLETQAESAEAMTAYAEKSRSKSA